MKITRALSALLYFGMLLPMAFAADYKVLPFQYADVTGEWGDPVSPTVVSAQWANKEGITGNPSDFGLKLAKEAATDVAASAGAAFKGPDGDVVSAATVFGYTYKNDSWCGAGAPRFNVKVTDGEQSATYAVGCANPSATTDPLDGTWTRKTWGPANFFFLSGDAAVPLLGSTIKSVVIVFDEGTDVGPGKATLDNIQYNEVFVGGPEATKE